MLLHAFHIFPKAALGVTKPYLGGGAWHEVFDPIPDVKTLQHQNLLLLYWMDLGCDDPLKQAKIFKFPPNVTSINL